jgi:hypothetical protein
MLSQKATIPLDISQKEMVDRSLLNYKGILPQKT